jgi:hypothetical protein
MSVHSILPERLTRAVGEVLAAAGIPHVAHDYADVGAAVEAAASDPQALALIGPFRSAEVAEAVEETAPVGLPLLAPVATWAGVTRDDEPCAGDPAHHRGTVFRLVARDTVVATRIADDVRREGKRALVVAGSHDYGRQLDGQLRLAELPRADVLRDADLVVLAGLAGRPEIERAAESSPLPLVAFDGVQGAELGERAVQLALPFEPLAGFSPDELFAGVERSDVAAELVVRAIREGAEGRPEMLANLRRLGRFDAHGDLEHAPVWLWRADRRWQLQPERPL